MYWQCLFHSPAEFYRLGAWIAAKMYTEGNEVIMPNAPTLTLNTGVELPALGLGVFQDTH